jgi:type II secretory pathway component PulF
MLPRIQTADDVAEHGGPTPVVVRMIVCGIACLPALLVLGYVVPQFAEIFAQLQERGELPVLSSGILALSQLNRSLFFLPTLLALALLATGDIAAAGLAQRHRRPAPYRLWLAVLLLTGWMAVVVMIYGLLLPIVRVSGTTV